MLTRLVLLCLALGTIACGGGGSTPRDAATEPGPDYGPIEGPHTSKLYDLPRPPDLPTASGEARPADAKQPAAQ